MAWHKKELLRNIERIAVGMAITRLDGTLECANAYLCKMLGVSRRDLVGLPFSLYAPGAGPAGQDESRQPPGASESMCRELRVRDTSGMMLDVLYAVYPLHDDAGVATHFVHLLQYLGDERQLGTLSRLAFYDALTGLPNRNLFNDRLDHALAAARRNCGAFALLCIDIDRFKQVNDTYGHEAGDELLREIATRLAQSVRGNDTVARWGGDEFVAILDGIAGQQLAARVVSKLLTACSRPYAVRGRDYVITLSIGVSLYPWDGHDAATLLERADRAMYEVKARGRNGYRIEESPSGYGLTAA